MYRLFGREPALWLAAISSSIMLASAFGVDLSIEVQSAINAACAAGFGLLTAWFVARDGLHAAILGFLKGILSLAIGFGWQVSPDKQSLIMFAATSVLALFVRSNATAPVDEAGKTMSERSVL